MPWGVFYLQKASAGQKQRLQRIFSTAQFILALHIIITIKVQ
jgi:hypothetical protein